MLRKLFKTAIVAAGVAVFTALPTQTANAVTNEEILEDNVFVQQGVAFDETAVEESAVNHDVQIVAVNSDFDELSVIGANGLAESLLYNESNENNTVIVVVRGEDTDRFGVASNSVDKSQLLESLNGADGRAEQKISYTLQNDTLFPSASSSSGFSFDGLAVGLGAAAVVAVSVWLVYGLVVLPRRNRKQQQDMEARANDLRNFAISIAQPVPDGFKGSASKKWVELQEHLKVVSSQQLDAESSYEVDRVKKDLQDLVKLVDSYNDLKSAPSEEELTEALTALDEEIKDIIEGKKAALNKQLASFRGWLSNRKKEKGLRL